MLGDVFKAKASGKGLNTEHEKQGPHRREEQCEQSWLRQQGVTRWPHCLRGSSRVPALMRRGQNCCSDTAQNSNRFQMIDKMLLLRTWAENNLIMKSLETALFMRYYLSWDKNEMQLIYSICAVKHSCGVRRCTVTETALYEVSIGQVSTIF